MGITPSEVDALECHGTGATLGDAIEVGAQRKVTSRAFRLEPLAITSSKTNIGHCEGSAGISGLFKGVVMCMHGRGTPNAHLRSLNPHIEMSGFPVIVAT